MLYSYWLEPLKKIYAAPKIIIIYFVVNEPAHGIIFVMTCLSEPIEK
jgi:hypothetical protein